MKKQEMDSKMPNEHLHKLFVGELKDMLDAERQLLKGLKKFESAARSEELKNAFNKHYTDTEGHIDSLKTILQNLGVAIRSTKCKAMEGLLNEGDEILKKFEDSPALDAALISAAQKIEHYEIASYGCLVTYAKLMKHADEEKILNLVLEQEKDTDTLLTEIAMKGVNEAEQV